MPQSHVIVVTHTPERLRRTLLGVACQSHTPDTITVTCDAEHDAIRDAVQAACDEFGLSATLIMRPKHELSRAGQARNNAVRLLTDDGIARDSALIFIDGDCVPTEHWARCIVDSFSAAHERVGALQGTYRAHGNLEQYAMLTSILGQVVDDRPRSVRSLATGNCAFRRAEILADPFDEIALYHGPDVRKATRILAAGQSIELRPAMAAIHQFRPGIGHVFQRGVYWGYCFLEFRRQPDVPHAWLFGRIGPLARQAPDDPEIQELFQEARRSVTAGQRLMIRRDRARLIRRSRFRRFR